MAFKLPELTQETTQTTSTGTYILDGRVAGFRGFGDGLSSGDTTIYCVFDSTVPPIYEINLGTWTSPNQLTRDTLIKSSTTFPINWGASVKNVVIGLPGVMMQTLLDMSLAAGYLKLTSGSPENLFSTQAVPIPVADGGTAGTTATTARDGIGALNRSLSEQTTLISTGDMYYLSGGVPARLAAGAGNNDKYLRVVSNVPAWTALLASHSTFTPTAPLTGTTVQSALDELTYSLSSVTTQSTAHSGVDFTTETAVNDLVNLTIPGLASPFSKKYRCHGFVTVTGIGASTELIVRVRVGTAGTVADAEKCRTYTTLNISSGSHSLIIPTDWWTPASGEKVTISLERTAGDTSISTTAAYTRVYIEQVRNA